MTDYHAKFNHDKYYHILNRGNNGENLFASKDNFTFFLKKWESFIQPYAGTLAYCLMPNHFHFLIRIENGIKAEKSTKPSRISRSHSTDDINKLLENKFRNLFSGYTLAFNKQQNRTGSLFQKRFKRIEIVDNNYLTTIIHYIHHNPIHHQFVNYYSKWKFSSYNAMLSEVKTSLNRNMVLDWFGGVKAFSKFHDDSKNFDTIKSLIME